MLSARQHTWIALLESQTNFGHVEKKVSDELRHSVMALNALKLITRATEKTWNKHGYVQSALLAQRLAFSSQDQAHAFWDDDGSSQVDQNKPTSRKPLEPPKGKQKPAETEPAEIVRHTMFGHIRLDAENRPSEIPQEEQETDKLNFIDDQFFGSSANKTTTQDGTIQTVTTSKDVPQDTNSIDQQYFYKSQLEKDPKEFLGPAPSALELDFSENEVDNQYFGLAKSETPQIKKSPLKVSAFDYLYSKKEDSKATKSTENTETNNEHWKKYISMVPIFTKLPDEAICALLKQNILYNKGKHFIKNSSFFFLNRTNVLSLDGVVALNKPYGLVTTDADKNSEFVLTKYLPRLSEKLGFKKLYTVHRLDRDTTGTHRVIIF